MNRIVLTDTPLPTENQPKDELHEGPCPDADDSTEDKISGQELLLGEPGPHTVLISVTGGGDASAVNVVCPARGPCPERDAALDHLFAAHRESQRCIREFIIELGGTVFEEVLLGNSLVAVLYAEQIQLVAAHLHVLSISPGESTTPPPS